MNNFQEKQNEQRLKISPPWLITESSLKETKDNQKEWHITIVFPRGSKIRNKDGQILPIESRSFKTWRHIDIDKHRCYIHCNVPQVKMADGKVQLADVPWARRQSQFSWDFEYEVMKQIKRGNAFKKIATHYGKNEVVVRAIFNNWMKLAYTNDKIDTRLSAIGLYELIIPHKNKHITLLIDLKNERVLKAIEHIGNEALQDCQKYLEAKGISSLQIKHISGPLSFEQMKNIKNYFPNTTYHVDKLYIEQELNHAIEKAMKQEYHQDKHPVKYYALLTKPLSSLRKNQQSKLVDLLTKFPNIERAYKTKQEFDKLWVQSSSVEAQNFLEGWCRTVLATPVLKPFKEIAETVIQISPSIINFKEHPTRLDAMGKIHNNTLKAISRTKNFSNSENTIAMIYFCCGKLTMPYTPTIR